MKFQKKFFLCFQRFGKIDLGTRGQILSAFTSERRPFLPTDQVTRGVREGGGVEIRRHVLSNSFVTRLDDRRREEGREGPVKHNRKFDLVPLQNNKSKRETSVAPKTVPPSWEVQDSVHGVSFSVWVQSTDEVESHLGPVERIGQTQSRRIKWFSCILTDYTKLPTQRVLSIQL